MARCLCSTVRVMKQTGNDLPSLYKEISEGGLTKENKHLIGSSLRSDACFRIR